MSVFNYPTDTRVEISAIAEMIETALDRMRKCSH